METNKTLNDLILNVFYRFTFLILSIFVYDLGINCYKIFEYLSVCKCFWSVYFDYWLLLGIYLSICARFGIEYKIYYWMLYLVT